MIIKYMLMCFTSIYLVSCASSGLKIQIENPLDQSRQSELLEIDRSLLGEQVQMDGMLVVKDQQKGIALPIQYLDLDQDGEWEQLLVKVSLEPREIRELLIEQATSPYFSTDAKVFGRFVPERKDDFAWENDRIAFRMYGPALEATGEISSGVDVWVKSVEYPIIDKWYATGEYHADHGEGADLYKVGPTLGCGGLGLLDSDTLYTSRNFVGYRILAEGPLRFVFELDYVTWGSDSLKIDETKRISLDAGQHFNHMTSRLRFSHPVADDDKIVSGLVTHPSLSENPVTIDSSDDYMLIYEDFKPGDGALGSAIIPKPLQKKEALKKDGNQYLMVVSPSADNQVEYYAGAAWSKSPWISSEADWKEYVTKYVAQLNHPIEILIKE